MVRIIPLIAVCSLTACQHNAMQSSEERFGKENRKTILLSKEHFRDSTPREIPSIAEWPIEEKKPAESPSEEVLLNQLLLHAQSLEKRIQKLEAQIQP